jgi:hypothetical protein
MRRRDGSLFQLPLHVDDAYLQGTGLIEDEAKLLLRGLACLVEQQHEFKNM